MVDLAVHYGPQYIPLKEVAQRQDISEKYLEQIVPALNRAGYVQSIRGAQGGYRLNGPPESYSVGMVIRLVEGQLAPAPCAGKNDHGECARSETCVTAGVWEKIRAAVDQVVDQITLDSLVKEYFERQKAQENQAGDAPSIQTV